MAGFADVRCPVCYEGGMGDHCPTHTPMERSLARRLYQARAELATIKRKPPVRCNHLDGTPAGTRLAYLTGDSVIVVGIPPDNESMEETGHNCDAMGCGQDHVIERWRVSRIDKPPVDVRAALDEAREALRQIAEFGHSAGCGASKNVPIYECGCYPISQWDIAREAIARIDALLAEKEKP